MKKRKMKVVIMMKKKIKTIKKMKKKKVVMIVNHQMNHKKNILLIKHIVTSKVKGQYKDLGLPEELISIYLKPKIYRTLQDNIYLIQNLEYLQCFQNILKNYKEGELIFETIN